MAEIARYDKNKGPVKTQPVTVPTNEVGLRSPVRAPDPYTPTPQPAPQASTAGLRWAKSLPSRVSKAMGMDMTPEQRTETLVKSLNPVRMIPNAIDLMVNSDTGQAIDASMRSTYDDRPNTFGIDDRAASSITSQGGFMPGTPGAEISMPTGAGLRQQEPIDDTMLRREPAPFTPSNPARGIGRVFTDQANAAAFTGPDGGPIVVTQGEDGQNIYTQDGKEFNLQDAIVAEGPQAAYRGAAGEFQPFDRRSGLPGYQVSEAPVIAGEGTNARILEPGFRQVAAGGGGGGGAAAPGGGGAPAGGFQFDAQRDQTAADLRGGRQIMEQEFAQTEQRVADLTSSYGQMQRAYQDAVRTGAPNASFLGDQLRAQEEQLRQAETDLDRQKTSLAFQPREGTYRMAADRITTNQQNRQAIRAAGGDPDAIDIREEMLKSLPAPDGTVETEVQRRRILAEITRMDQAARNADIEGVKAQASYRSALASERKGEETPAQRAQRLAAAKKDTASAMETMRGLEKDLGVVFENAFDATGAPIPGQSVTMPEFGLSIPATQWAGVQSYAYDTIIPAMKNDPAFADYTEQEIIRDAMRRSLLSHGATQE